jgi:hypothetical protein
VFRTENKPNDYYNDYYMLDLAIPIETDANGITVIETNRGQAMKAPSWPQDSEFQIVAFGPTGKTCEIIWTEQLAQDIGKALAALDSSRALQGRKPDWYSRLRSCASGASSD